MAGSSGDPKAYALRVIKKYETEGREKCLYNYIALDFFRSSSMTRRLQKYPEVESIIVGRHHAQDISESMQTSPPNHGYIPAERLEERRQLRELFASRKINAALLRAAYI